MRLRTTSEGYTWEVGFDPIQALLYDFDVGSAQLKPAHKKYLDEHVVKKVLAGTGKTWKIKLEGRASRTGSRDRNLTLSRQRAEAVYAYLAERAPKAKLSKDWVGEELAERMGEKDETENLFYRAVEVVIRSEGQPPPPPIKGKPPKPAVPPARKAYAVRVLGGSSTSVSIPIPGPPGISPSLSRDHYTLEFWDKEEKVTATYLFDGMGKGLGASPKFSGGVTLSGGPWNDFTAPRTVAIEDFRGPAMFEFLSASYVAGTVGPTAFSFRPLHWYSPTFGFRINPFNMGRTIGTPGVTVGDTMGELKFIKKKTK